eukprot:299507_1
MTAELFDNIKGNLKKIQTELYEFDLQRYCEELDIGIIFTSKQIGWPSIFGNKLIFVELKYLIPSISVRTKSNKNSELLQFTMKYHTPIWKDYILKLSPNIKNKNYCYKSLSGVNGAEFLTEISNFKKNFVLDSINNIEEVIMRKQNMITCVLDSILNNVMELCNENECNDNEYVQNDVPMPPLSPRSNEHPFGGCDIAVFDLMKWSLS